ncbi:MAG: methyltransferase domain-containing protein [Gammaproteobacteria bacterium]
MGDANQYQFVLQQKDTLSGPFLEIGSRDYGSTRNLRSLFPGETYIGVDLGMGNGVDKVLDLTLPFDSIDAALGQQRFGAIFSFSVMEHCDQPFLMAENMTRLLRPGGKIVLSVPFAWKFHGYPSDYWRFTQAGVKKLFPGIDWDAGGPGCWHSPNKGDFRAIDESVGILPLSGKHYRRHGMPLRGIGLDILKLLQLLGLYRWLFGNRYLVIPAMIDMVGTLREHR